jgi:hypothetical protein
MVCVWLDKKWRRQWKQSWCVLALSLLAGAGSVAAAGAQESQGPQQPTPATGAADATDTAGTTGAAKPRSSVSLAPAVVMVRGKPGQSYTQILTLTNQTRQEFVFEMVAQDVVVREGRRSFVPAGDTAGSIAATAVFSQKQAAVQAGQSTSVAVTFTMPPGTELRAAVALFEGVNKISTGGPVTMTASLGALFTFTVSNNFQVEGLPIEVTAQSATANLGISQVLMNKGTEPIVASGTAAVLNEKGKLLGKTLFDGKRLLPGEQSAFRAEYPGELRKGRYRVLASFQYEDKVVTNSADLVVP